MKFFSTNTKFAMIPETIAMHQLLVDWTVHSIDFGLQLPIKTRNEWRIDKVTSCLQIGDIITVQWNLFTIAEYIIFSIYLLVSN